MDFTKVVSSDPLDKLKHILLFLTSIPLQSEFSEGNVHTFSLWRGQGREEGYVTQIWNMNSPFWSGIKRYIH